MPKPTHGYPPDARPTDYYVVLPSDLIELGPYVVTVYAVLRDFADKRSGECWPSHQAIAKRAGISSRKVREVLTILRDHGWITWTQRKGENNSLTSNYYHVYGSADRRQDVQTLRHEVPGVRHEVPEGVRQDVPGVRHEVPSELVTSELVTSEELTSTPADATIDERPDVTDVVHYLCQSLDALDVKHSPTPEWHRTIRLMIDKDGRTPEQIKGAIQWAHADDFWRGNIHSPRSLRKQYDTLRLHAQRKQHATPMNQALQLAAQYQAAGV